MANSKKIVQAAAGAGGEALNVEDVFSTYLYEGNGSTQTITNGIDLDGEGGLVWIKRRQTTGAHLLWSTEYTGNLNSTNTDALNNTSLTPTFNSNGFTIGPSSWTSLNASGSDYASWTWRKAPKFFDVVTYTGTGSAQNISHNLGVTPGCVIVKSTTNSEDWVVYHRSLGGTYYGKLNDTAQFLGPNTTVFNGTDATDSVFSVGTNSKSNGSGQTYVAYLFAHNDGDGEFGPDGDADIIKCGSYTGNGTKLDINLGFEAQWVLVKRTDTSGYDWHLFDVMRGMPVGSDAKWLEPNTSGAEGSNQYMSANSNGFTLPDGHPEVCASGGTYIYIAIRRGPMAVPESATDVFDVTFDGATDGKKPYIRSDTGVVDLIIANSRTGTTYHRPVTRLTSGRYLQTTSSAAEVTQAGWEFDFQNGVYDLAGSSVNTNGISWMWKRAPNFCDVVAYKGNGVTDGSHKISHNLGVVPEMMWVKGRDVAYPWVIYHKDLTSSQYSLYFDAAAQAQTYQFNVDPISTEFTVASNYVNNASYNYIAYLFASLDGVSKVGSYTGNTTGTNPTDTQTIECGFSPRFVLVKAISTTGQWAVWDTERGIVAGDDPTLYLDSTSAEDTYDFIDPYATGFTMTNLFGNYNQSGVTYIFYAIA